MTMDIDALYAAAIAGDADAIARLEMKADRLTEDDETILHIESEAGNTERVRFILREFARKNLLLKLTKQKHTALHLAAYDGHTQVAEVLIDAARQLPSASFQAFLRQGDKDSDTALHAAVMYGHLDIVKLLVEADPTDRHVQNNDEGKTPMYIAAEKGYNDIVQLICQTCTAPSLDGPGDSTALHAAILNFHKGNDKNIDVIRMIIGAAKRLSHFETLFTRTDENGRTVLQLAVNGNNPTVVEQILLEDQAYHDGRGTKRHQLMSLIYEAMGMGYSKDIVKLLSDAYEAGINPLHRGVLALILNIRRRDKGSILGLLNDNEHMVTFVDDEGWTVLHYTAYHEFDSLLNAIVDAQKNVGYQFVYKEMALTPFHVAAECGYTSTVIRLMQLWPASSSAYTSINETGQNILHLAASQSNKEMIQGILKYCPGNYMENFLNKQDDNGNTPLHLLILRGCFIPQFMKYEGLDTMIKNNKKWTPRDMLYFHDEIIADQVQIKIVLDEVQANQKMDIFESLVGKREAKDVMFDKCTKLLIHEKHARMKEDQERYEISHATAGLEMRADILNEEGQTILHLESMKGDAERVRLILTEFGNKNLLVKGDRYKQTALHLAARHGHAEVVEVLIDAARDLLDFSESDDTESDDTNYRVGSNFQDFIRQPAGPMLNTALHVAVLNGDVAIVELLVEADPRDRHVQNNEGKTPIYIAAEHGYKNIIKVICTTCTAQSLEGPGGGATALHALIKNIQQETEEGRDVIGMFIYAARLWSSAEDDKASFEALFNRTDDAGSTVLQLAVERNYLDAVKLILLEDPTYEHGREIKRNGLMRLIYKAIDQEYSNDIVKLLSQKYEFGIKSPHTGVLALILAIKKGDIESVLNGLLGDGKHLVTFADEEGWTALHYAACHECIPILDAIIDAQKVVEHPFVYADMVSTPLQVAAENGHTYSVIRLLQLWPTPSSAYTAVNKNGRNVLHLAAAKKDSKMIQGILEYCPEKYKDKILKEQDANGDTPLHIVISNGCFVRELINYKGFDTMPKNKKKWTPQEMLYFQDDIIGDQVQIKIALDHIQTNKSTKFWQKSTKKETDIFKSMVIPSKRETKNVKFKEETKSWMDKKHAVMQNEMKTKLVRYKKRTNTQIIVTALITTVTFTVGFTMPGGLHQSGEVDEGLAVLSKNTAFNAFMVSDALALLLSTSSLFFYFLESMNEDPQQVSKLSVTSTVLNIVSLVAMMLTFIAGTYVVLSHTPVLAITVCCIGFLFFLLLIFISIKIVCDCKGKQSED